MEAQGDNLDPDALEHGFLDHNGKFLTRKAAGTLARETGQTTKAGDLHSQYLAPFNAAAAS